MGHHLKLHENEKDFSQAIQATASALGIREVFVQKDYWVCYILKNLSLSEHKSHVVFKGGTSLSKAHKVIHRFSEDVDLAIISNKLTDNQIKPLMKKIESVIATTPLKELADHVAVSKGSKYRKTVWEYNRILAGDFGDASKDLILEINSFTKPSPFNLVSIQTYIADFFAQNNLNDDLISNELHPFQVNVLDLKRTITEKVAAIAGASSRQPDDHSELKNKIRHLYDLAMLLRIPHVVEFINSGEFLEMYETVKIEDKNIPGQRQNSDQHILEAPIFKSTNAVLTDLTDTYQNKFMSLVYKTEDAPQIKEIKAALELVKKRF